MSLPIALAVALLQSAAALPADTLRLEVGAREIDGRVYAPHLACVRVRVGDDPTVVTHWTNQLTLGDSAGRAVQRWVTKGTRYAPDGSPVTWELRQTYDARTLAPYAYHASSGAGALTVLTIDGRRVRGTKRANATADVVPLDVEIDRPGFVAGASDLVPLAAGVKAGLVMTAPMWVPGAARAELRVFVVTGEKALDVEGARVTAWEIEERRHADDVLLARWYMTDRSPYMVYGETYAPDGEVRKMTEVDVKSESACTR